MRRKADGRATSRINMETDEQRDNIAAKARGVFILRHLRKDGVRIHLIVTWKDGWVSE